MDLPAHQPETENESAAASSSRRDGNDVYIWDSDDLPSDLRPGSDSDEVPVRSKKRKRSRKSSKGKGKAYADRLVLFSSLLYLFWSIPLLHIYIISVPSANL